LEFFCKNILGAIPSFAIQCITLGAERIFTKIDANKDQNNPIEIIYKNICLFVAYWNALNIGF